MEDALAAGAATPCPTGRANPRPRQQLRRRSRHGRRLGRRRRDLLADHARQMAELWPVAVRRARSIWRRPGRREVARHARRLADPAAGRCATSVGSHQRDRAMSVDCRRRQRLGETVAAARRRGRPATAHRGRRRSSPLARRRCAPALWRCAELRLDASRLEMDFGFLLRPGRQLLSIGYRVAEEQPRSELLRPARLRGAAGQLHRDRQGRCAAEHWFQLGRALTPVGRGSALISWSGSMFEYLMPSLVMRAPAGSLISTRPRKLIVSRQIEYGNELRRAVGNFGSRPTMRRDLELDLPVFAASACPTSA